MTWHVDPATAERYVRSELDATSSASLEAHVLACDECRSLIGGAAHDPILDDLWMEIVDAIDRPRLGYVERFLMTTGVSEASARVVAATSRARWSYLLAVLLSLLFALLAWQSDRAQPLGMFLVLAPLGPLAATATAFGKWSDPTYELARTLPASSFRLLIVRTAASVVPAMVLTAVSLPWLADHGWLAVAWLLPSLALTLGTLALSTWVPVEWAALLLALVWVSVPFALRHDVRELLDLIGGPVQVVSLVAIFAGGTVTLLRRSAFEYQEI